MQPVVTCLAVMVCLAGAVFAADEGVPGSVALFKQLDSNGDGQLTSDEVSDEKRPLFDRLVRKADDNDDGKLSREEFEAAHQEDASPNLPLNVGGGRPGRGGGDIRQRFAMLDRNKDGKVTRDEIPEQVRQRLAPLFDRLGKDELTVDDFDRFVRPDPNRTDADRNLNAGPRGPVFMRLLDSDRNGRISKAEWAKAGEVFSQLDANGDGELDPRELMGPLREDMTDNRERMELREGRNRPGDSNPREGGQFFARLDANGDGKLSKDEAPPRLRERFDRLDKNSDGSLTPDELRNAFPAGDRPAGETNRKEGRARPKRPVAE